MRISSTLRGILPGLLAWCALLATGHVASAPLPPQPRTATPAVAAPPYLGAERRVGELTVHWCKQVHTYCGTMRRPFDPTGTMAGSIDIYFEYYPRQDQQTASQGMLVAVEGGPGYPSTGSRSIYLPLYGPLLKHRELVLMDNRGTGRSKLIDCHIQHVAELNQWNIAECGRQLGATAPLYSGLYAADDLAALLGKLHAPKIDLYGDSYGTYFGQTFAYHHPEWLRTLVLDSAYPVPMVGGETAWYPTFVPAMRDKYNLVCARSPGCREQPGSSMEHIQPAIDLLRSAPFEAQAQDANGLWRQFTADAAQMANMMMSASPPNTTARETDAAARAFAQGDQAPLLRLMAETIATADPTGPLYFSMGAFMAVNCQDVAQIYDMRLATPPRKRQRDRAVAEQKQADPDLYAPFTIDEFRAMPLDLSLLDACVSWPAPAPQHPPGPHVPPNPAMPDVPVLVLAGELDDITTPAESEIVAGLFPDSHFVLVANTFHVTTSPTIYDPCATRIVREFIAAGSLGDTRCASRVTPLRAVPQFARSIDELTPATAQAGNQATARELRAARAAVHTLGDALGRYESNTTGQGIGLRGGSFTAENRGSLQRLELVATRWTEDLAVSGLLLWPAQRGTANANILLTGPDGMQGHLRVQWNEREPDALAHIEGQINGHTVHASMGAP